MTRIVNEGFFINDLFIFSLLFLLKVKWNFYKQNLERFVKIFKEFNVIDFERIEGRIE